MPSVLGIVILGVLLFGTMSLIFPFSNKITGPIDDDSEATMDAGSGSGFNLSANVSIELDYCGNVISGENSENLVNENSVKRVPARVWFTLIFIVGTWITSEFVWRHFATSVAYFLNL